MSGLTTEGLEIKTLAEIRDAMLEVLKAPPPNGLGIDVSNVPESVLYGLASICAAANRDVYELLQLIYDAMSPDNATGTMLDNLCAIVGVTRLQATKAQFTVRCYGTPGTTIPDYTGATPGIVGRPAFGDFFDILPEPTGVGWIIPGGGSVDVTVQAQIAEAKVISDDQVTQILHSVAGWTSVNNPAAVGPVTNSGTDDETDSELRLRRAKSPMAVGTSTDQAIKARVGALDYVENVTCVSNRSMTTDPVTNQPGKSFWVCVWPDTLTTAQKEEIAETIWNAMPAGIEPWGGDDPANEVEVTITDVQGYAQTIKYSFADEIPLSAHVAVTHDADYPADGDAQVKAAILGVNALSVGDQVKVSPILGRIGDIAGITDFKLQIKRKASLPFGVWPLDGTTVAIGSGEIATITAGDITVTS